MITTYPPSEHVVAYKRLLTEMLQVVRDPRKVVLLQRTATTLTMAYRVTVARTLDLQSDSRITFGPATVAIMATVAR